MPPVQPMTPYEPADPVPNPLGNPMGNPMGNSMGNPMEYTAMAESMNGPLGNPMGYNPMGEMGQMGSMGMNMNGMNMNGMSMGNMNGMNMGGMGQMNGMQMGNSMGSGPMGNNSMGSGPMGSGPMNGMNGQMSATSLAPNGLPMVQQAPSNEKPKKDISSLIKTVVIVIVSLIAVTFIGLFIWIMVEYNNAQETIEDRVDAAEAKARDEQFTQDNERFAEQEKNPYRTFTGPVDYGQLSFQYPKTWSLYIESDASKGGNYNAYFNPIEVNTVSNTTINALRVTISTTPFDNVVESYQGDLQGKDPRLHLETVEIGAENSRTTANRYTGIIPGTELNGIIVVFKIRDKTVILQTDSMYFQGDFDKLLGTITFNA